MQHTRQGPRLWTVRVLLLLLAGLLLLEVLLPLSSGGHQLVQLAMTLLMVGVMLYWLRRNRGALVHAAYEREPAPGPAARQPGRELVINHGAPWDDAELPWHRHGHGTDRRP